MQEGYDDRQEALLVKGEQQVKEEKRQKTNSQGNSQTQRRVKSPQQKRYHRHVVLACNASYVRLDDQVNADEGVG